MEDGNLVVDIAVLVNVEFYNPLEDFGQGRSNRVRPAAIKIERVFVSVGN